MSTKIPIETSARHIHVSQEDFRFLPVYHFDVEIKSPEKPVKVLKSYNDEPVAFTYENGKVKISIDRLDCFDMYTLCYA